MNSLIDEVETSREGAQAALASGLMAFMGFAAWTGVSLADAALRASAGEKFFMREAWDSEIYIYLGLPLLMLAAAIAGFLMPRQAWRWPLWLVTGQIVGLIVFAVPQGGLSLMPLGMGLLGIGALLLLVPAYIGVLAAWAAERT